MNCESCRVRPVEIEEYSDMSNSPYRLCMPCHHRLVQSSLRPLEFFNLASIHGNSALLHDDFYDDYTGEALQSGIEVIDAEKFPFPKIEQAKSDIALLIDLAFVQIFTQERVIAHLRLFDSKDVLSRIAEKVNYNRAINYKAYEIVGKVVGRGAEQWIISQWNKRQKGELPIFAQAMANCLDFNDAFSLIARELGNGDEKFLNENISALQYLQNKKILGWIEENISRVNSISTNWGHLAASSQFTFATAEKWLTMGRPLSLVALDALVFCTTTGERSNQSPWMRQIRPRLPDRPPVDQLSATLYKYLKTDTNPRTKNAVVAVIDNLLME